MFDLPGLKAVCVFVNSLTNFKIMTNLTKSLAVGLVAIGSVSSIQASPIEFIFSGTASGILDNVPFSSDPFQIDLFGNTSDIGFSFGAGIPAIKGLTGTVAISGVLSDTMTAPLYVFDNQKVNTLGFGVIGSEDWLDLGENPALHTYGLSTSFASLSITANFDPSFDLTTSGGYVFFTSVSDTSFQAITSASVPDGGETLALFGTSLSALACLRRRTRSK